MTCKTICKLDGSGKIEQYHYACDIKHRFPDSRVFDYIGNGIVLAIEINNEFKIQNGEMRLAFFKLNPNRDRQAA